MFAAFFEVLREAVGPQKVLVGGVPTNSRHGHVMIDADYHMKRVSQGHVKVPDVTSAIDLSLNSDKAALLKYGAF